MSKALNLFQIWIWTVLEKKLTKISKIWINQEKEALYNHVNISLHFRSPWIGSGLAMLFVVTHMLASGLYTHEKNFPPTNTFTVNPLKDANTDMGNTIYIKPWFRWGTYAVGMLLGLLLHLIHTKKLKIKLNAVSNEFVANI